MIPTSDHNEALAGDTLYSAFLNHEWREIVLPFIVAGMEKIAATIEDETERQTFEVRYGAMIDDFYNEDIVDGTPIGVIATFIGEIASIPPKYLLCNGATYAQADYPELAAILPSTFLSGSNFTVPALSGRFIRGAVADNVIGEIGGALNVTLTVANLPAHHHTVPAHSHTFLKGSAVASQNLRAALGNNAAQADQVTSTHPATDTSDTGGGLDFAIIPPYQRFLYIIKALP